MNRKCAHLAVIAAAARSRRL